MASKRGIWPGLPALLDKAAGALREKDIADYGLLRGFVCSGMVGDRQQFERHFSSYYGLYAAGLTPEFRAMYFELLFGYRPDERSDPHAAILQRLYEFPRRQGGHIIAASFATKLVAIHDESWPLFDRHVRAFFGVGVPDYGPSDFRIAEFVRNLWWIRETYEEWNTAPELNAVIHGLRTRHPALAATHPNRLCDFLVWATGARLIADKKP